MLNLFDKGNVRTEGDDCDPVLTRRSRSAASVDSADPVENQTFFTKSKILEKVVNQVQGGAKLQLFVSLLFQFVIILIKFG